MPLVENVDLFVPQRLGRPRSGGCEMEYARELRMEDFENEPQGQGQRLQKLRESHHSVARLCASGLEPGEVAAATGRSPSGVKLLLADPMFQELVEYYRGQADAKYLDVHQQLAELGVAATLELRDRLETDPESFSNAELRKTAEFALDRTITAGTAPQRGGPVKVEIEFVAPRAQQGPATDLVIDEEVA